jgi:hypothetical protein
MRLNEDPRLFGIFYKFKYGEYSFNYEGPNVIDLNTSKERDLVYFLDFLNAVDAALRKHIITMRDLDDTTIGFTIRLANRCGPIGRFMTFIRRRDADLKLPVHAWGAMEQRRPVEVSLHGGRALRVGIDHTTNKAAGSAD